MLRRSADGQIPSIALRPAWAIATASAAGPTKTHPAQTDSASTAVIGFRRKTRPIDQASVIERNQMRADQVVARVRLAAVDRRIARLRKQTDGVES